MLPWQASDLSVQIQLVRAIPDTPAQKGPIMTKTYTSLEQLPLALSAEDVAQVLGISRANAYALMHSKGFPTLKIGKRMTVPKDKLIEWMEKQLAG